MPPTDPGQRATQVPESPDSRLARLERENAMLRAAIRACPAGILIASAPDGVIQEWNPAALGIRGAEAAELTQIPLAQHPDQWQTFHPSGEIYAPEDLPLSRALLKGEVVDGDEVIIRDTSGADRWVLGHAAPVYDDHGNLIAGVVVFPDVTERMHIERQARRLQAMIEATPSAVIQANLDGTVDYLNPAAYAMCKLPETTAPGDVQLRDLFTVAGARVVFEDCLPAALRDGFCRLEAELAAADGVTVPVSGLVTVTADDRGELNQLSLIVGDVSEIRRLEAQFAQSQRMEAIGRLAGGVAHDFNNLLTLIINYTLMTQETLEPGSPGHDDLEQVVMASERAADLCRNLLGFARRQIIEPKILHLGDVIADMEKLLQRSLGEDVRLKTDIEHQLWRVRMDRSQLDQVLINLVVNAREAMPAGGELTIAARNAVLDERYASEHPEVAPGEYVMMTVADTGVGIGPELLPVVFEPFFSTKERGHSSGLGLATVHGAVKQNGGQIAVHSERDQGTTFELYWPRAEGLVEPAVDTDLTARVDAAGVVMVVEDEAEIRKLAEKLLADAGYQVLAASDGHTALQMEADHDGAIDLLVTDVVLPHMNGRQVADAMRSRRPALKVLFMSGYTEDAIVDRGEVAGDLEFLAKPFARDAFLTRVRALVTEEP